MVKYLSILLLFFNFSVLAQKNNQIIINKNKSSSFQGKDSLTISAVKAIPISSYVSSTPKLITLTGVEKQSTKASIKLAPVKVSLIGPKTQPSVKMKTIQTNENTNKSKSRKNIVMPAVHVVRYQEKSTKNPKQNLIKDK